MFGKWGVLVFATLAVGAVLSSSAGASPQGTSRGIDLSSRAGVAQYLTSLGVDARGIVVQRGAHNYAGPNCPGRGWTCTTATRVLQIAANGPGNGDDGDDGDDGDNGDNRFQCTASTGPGGSASPPNGCTIVQVSTGGDNRARCVEGSGDASVSQSCVIFQTSTTGDNHLQVQQQVDAKGGATQAATQYAGVDQINGSGSNEARIRQDLEQSTRDTDATGTQTQNGHQGVSVNQLSGTGDNTARVHQSLALKAKATGATVSQNQNTGGSGLNTSTGITQDSTSGQNKAHLNQSNELDGTVSRTSNGSQTQGSPSGGLGGFFSQNSTGLSTVKLKQREHQDLNIGGGDNRENGRDDHGKKKPPPPPGVVTQTQYGPMWADPSQGSNPGDRYDISQSSSQHASNPTFQDDRAYGQCETSGNCTIDQRIQQQGQGHTNSCSGPSCNIGLTVTLSDGETSTSTCEGSDSDFSCPRPPPPPPPPVPPISGCGVDCIK